MQGAGVQPLIRELGPIFEFKVHTPQLRILCATANTQHSQIN